MEIPQTHWYEYNVSFEMISMRFTIIIMFFFSSREKNFSSKWQTAKTIRALNWNESRFLCYIEKSPPKVASSQTPCLSMLLQLPLFLIVKCELKPLACLKFNKNSQQNIQFFFCN